MVGLFLAHLSPCNAPLLDTLLHPLLHLTCCAPPATRTSGCTSKPLPLRRAVHHVRQLWAGARRQTVRRAWLYGLAQVALCLLCVFVCQRGNSSPSQGCATPYKAACFACWLLLMQAQDSSGEEGGRRQEDAAGTGNRHVCALHACAQAAVGQQGGGGESKGHSELGSVQESVARRFSLETAKAPVPCACHPLKPASLLPCCLHELQGKICFPPSPMICTRACP